MSPLGWLFSAFVFAVLGLPILGGVVYSLTTEKAHEMIWTPLKQWAGAHPLIFRSIVITLGCLVVSRWIWWLGWVGLIVWASLLIAKHWRDPWVVPLWKWIAAKIARKPRAYRDEGEQAAHEDDLQQTKTTLAQMALEARSNDDSEILAVLSGIKILKGRLKGLNNLERRGDLTGAREVERAMVRRDLRTHMAMQRQVEPPRPMGLLGGLAAAPLLSGPILWIGGALLVWGVGATGVAWERGVRLEHVKHVAEEQQAAAMAWRTRSQQQQEALNAARAQSQASAETIEQERERSRAYARQQARMRDAIRQVDSGGDPPDWGIGVRDVGAAPGGTAAPGTGG
jgi:hypothetical protein